MCTFEDQDKLQVSLDALTGVSQIVQGVIPVTATIWFSKYPALAGIDYPMNLEAFPKVSLSLHPSCLALIGHWSYVQIWSYVHLATRLSGLASSRQVSLIDWLASGAGTHWPTGIPSKPQSSFFSLSPAPHRKTCHYSPSGILFWNTIHLLESPPTEAAILLLLSLALSCSSLFTF